VALYAGTATDNLLTARRTADFSTEKSILCTKKNVSESLAFQMNISPPFSRLQYLHARNKHEACSNILIAFSEKEVSAVHLYIMIHCCF
jgi:hypothetical protein